MLDTYQVYRELSESMDPAAADKITSVISLVYQELRLMVTKSEFNELKEIVRDLARAQNRTERKIGELTEAQNRTEQRMEELAEAQKDLVGAQNRTEQRMEKLAEAQNRTEQKVGELTEAQERTEQRMDELAESQKRTEQRMDELAESQKRIEQKVEKLSDGLNKTRSELGGLSKGVGYALENESYRMLPGLLSRKYGIEMTERFIRTEMGGKEINIFGEGLRNGERILIVGETKMQLDERRKSKGEQKEIFEILADKVAAVKSEQPNTDVTIVPLLVTHYANKRLLERGKEAGVIIVQSFEW